VVETEGNLGLAQVRDKQKWGFPHPCTRTPQHKGSASSTWWRKVGLHSRDTRFSIGAHVQVRDVQPWCWGAPD
jgi:hypothetical protein